MPSPVPSPASSAPDYRAWDGRVAPPRAHLKSDAPAFDLGGSWDFTLVRGDELRTGTMPVPSHWVLVDDGAWGRPAYTNVQYPFPVDPPFVPDPNPTGTYRRTFRLPDGWPAAGRDLVRLLGAESEATVTLNGTLVGMGRGSRLTHEYDATGLLQAGDNKVEITVRQWSSGSYLEDQDQWWLPGLFRDVELLHRPVGGIDDAWLDADFDPASGRGTLRVELDAPTAGPVRLTVPELGLSQTLEAASTTVHAGPVEPWSAEAPRLYDATLSTASEVLSIRIGFRRTEIVDGRWLVNGRPVVWRGVNRHEVNRTRGRVFDETAARADLALMKAFNVNAIRTSHYPPHPRLLDLADELGFYVMLENDYESHGFGLDGWRDCPSDDPRWQDALLDRMRRTVERDKNHPSVIAWSLGNEAHTGANLAAMAEWTRRRDPSRPIHYEGDHEAAYTDIYSRMYPSVAEVALVLDRDSGPVAAQGHAAARVSDADAARIRSLPYFLCEYAHAMGTGPGGISGYTAAFGHGRHAGGCVWEWRDHALDRRLPDGRVALGYGGDFGEDVHDGNFVCDGLVSADSVPSAGLVAWANAVAPVVAVPEASGAITVTSDLRLAKVPGLVVSWYAGSGWSDARGEFEILDLAPGASVTVRPELPAGFGGALDVMTAWVLDPGTPGIAARSPRAVDLHGHALPPNVGEADESDRRVAGVRQWVRPWPTLQVRDRTPSIGTGGQPAEAAEDLVRQLRPVLFRGPTDNDRGGHPSDAGRWADARLPLLEHRVVDAADGRLVLASGVPSRQRRLTTTLTWRAGRRGMDVSAAFEFAGDWPNLPRIGLTVPLPAESWDGAQVAWAGLGPTENYSDLTEGVFLGRFAGGIDELWTTRIRPQEAGHRGLVTDLAMEGRSRLDVRADAPGFGFSLCRWTPRQLDATTHPEELPPSDTWWLTIDAVHAGIGTASCGPATDTRFAVKPTARGLVFSLSHRRG